MQVILITTDMHLRTAINKLIGNKAITLKTNNEIYSFIGSEYLNNSIMIIDEFYPDCQNIIYSTLSKHMLLKVIVLMGAKREYLTPITRGQLTYVRRPLTLNYLKLSNIDTIVKEADVTYLDSPIIGHSEAILKIKKLIHTLRSNKCNILLSGETGTGKEIIANAIHSSWYPNSKMIIENCSLIEGELMDAHLFGHTKGSYTGAITDDEGLIQKANETTLFLDEIEELSNHSQAKLLRLIENGEYRIVGSTEIKHSNFSLITATNIKTKELLKQNYLRRDFYHRICDLEIEIPPLRNRIEDIPELCTHYEKLRGYKDRISSFDIMFSHDWPGNIRELFTTIDRIHMLDPDYLIPTTSILKSEII